MFGKRYFGTRWFGVRFWGHGFSPVLIVYPDPFGARLLASTDFAGVDAQKVQPSP